MNWLEENEQILLVAEQTDAANFRNEIKTLDNYFSNLKIHVAPSNSFPFPALSTYMHQVIASKRKHAALLADTESYSAAKIERLHQMFETLNQNSTKVEMMERTAQWDTLLKHRTNLQNLLNSRSHALQFMENWLFSITNLGNLIQNMQNRIEEWSGIALQDIVREEVLLQCLQRDAQSLESWHKSMHELISENTADECKRKWLIFSDVEAISQLCMRIVANSKQNIGESLKIMEEYNQLKQNTFRISQEIKNERSWLEVS